jgi:hypothetical protein
MLPFTHVLRRTDKTAEEADAPFLAACLETGRVEGEPGVPNSDLVYGLGSGRGATYHRVKAIVTGKSGEYIVAITVERLSGRSLFAKAFPFILSLIAVSGGHLKGGPLVFLVACLALVEALFSAPLF